MKNLHAYTMLPWFTLVDSHEKTSCTVNFFLEISVRTLSAST